jgi:hypothetical protein
MFLIRVVSVIPRRTHAVAASGTLQLTDRALSLWPAERPGNPVHQECGIVCNDEVVVVA